MGKGCGARLPPSQLNVGCVTLGKATTSTNFNFYKIQIMMVMIPPRAFGGRLDELLSNSQDGPRRVPHVCILRVSQVATVMLQKREPCAGKGGKSMGGVHSHFFLFAESESDFCFEKPQIVYLCGSSEKSHSRGEEGNMRRIKRSVLWPGPPWESGSSTPRQDTQTVYSTFT